MSKILFDKLSRQCGLQFFQLKKFEELELSSFLPPSIFNRQNTFTTCYSLHPTSIFFFVTRKERGTKKEHGTKKTWD